MLRQVANPAILSDLFLAVKETKKRVDVPMPQMIHSYNPWMGAHLFDQFVGNYRICIKSKKWWWMFFLWSIDVCVRNFWILFKSVKNRALPPPNFRYQVAQQVLKQCGTLWIRL